MFDRLILAELGKCRTILERGREVVTRFFVFGADSDFEILVPMLDDYEVRAQRYALVGHLMALRQARGFLFCTRCLEPEATIETLVISRWDQRGARQLIGPPLRPPNGTVCRATISDPEWLDSGSIDDGFRALLPPTDHRGPENMAPEDVKALQTYFTGLAPGDIVILPAEPDG